MNLHAALMIICTSGSNPLFFIAILNYITHCLTEFTSTFLSFCNYWWIKCFLQEEIQWYTSALYVLLCQMPFYQTRAHLLKVRNYIDYGQEVSSSIFKSLKTSSDFVVLVLEPLFYVKLCRWMNNNLVA